MIAFLKVLRRLEDLLFAGQSHIQQAGFPLEEPQKGQAGEKRRASWR